MNILKDNEQLKDIKNNVVTALTKSFFAANYADLRTHKYVTVESMDYARKMVENCETIEQAFESFISTLVKPEFQEKMRKFCDSETIADRVKGKKHIDCEYLSNVARGWCRASFYPTEWDEQGAVTHVLFAVTSIDEGNAKEIEEGITAKRNLEQKLEKSHASLVSALGASNQLGYEYDPVEHTGECLTDENFFGLPKYIENYPDSLREIDLFHPEDVDKFISAAHKMDNGETESQCDVRIKKNDEYRWYSCTFYAYYDSDKERNVAILSVLDINFRMDMIQIYKDRLHAMERSNEDALYMCDVNLTRNEYSNLQADSIIKTYEENAKTLDEFMIRISLAVFDKEEQDNYRSLFQREKLLELFETGETQIKMEYFYRIDQKHTALMETLFELMREPITGDVVGVCYAKDLNISKLSGILLNSALDKDYPMAALVYTDTEEYYLYDVDRKEYCKHKQHYWQAVYERLVEAAGGQELPEIRENLTREKVVTFLEDHEEYTYVFYGAYREKRCRLEAKYRYIDKKHHLIIATLRNITDEALYQKYKHDSEHDLLTDLYNRKTVFGKCRELLKSQPDEQFVMMHIDIQRFHLYNTFFGDEAGDNLLCSIADELINIAKDYDYIAYGRMEADVFCMFFPVNRGLFEGHVLKSFEKLEAFSPDFPLALSVGAYWVTDPTMSIEAMFSRATIAAKSHKYNLFGRISKYDESMEQELKDTQQITSEMTAAIEKEQFEVYLQPKYSLRSEKVVGAEALVRWNHPERGMIAPGKFISAFEKNGFITEMDRYMWEHVCQILCRWQKEGRQMLPVSVNISRVSMYSHITVPFLKSLIRKYKIDPKYLELELTETAYMDDPKDLKRVLKELQKFGFKILMDDFGSGYSSLNTLRELPVDVLKLDMKFLAITKNDLRGLAVLSSVVRMSKLLNLPIVAEGVEKREQADYLRSIGCEYVQGFLFARPMPIEEYEQLLDSSEGEQIVLSVNEANAGVAAITGIIAEDPMVSLGIIEYADGRFAFSRTNKKFLTEFDLVENLNPASKVFREHLDDKNYNNMLQAFANCAATKVETLFCITWNADDGRNRKYQGHVFYKGNVGNYSELSVVFLNITNMNVFGFVDAYSEQEQYIKKTDAMIQSLDNTGVLMFMYYPQTRTVMIPEKTRALYGCSAVYKNMPDSFAEAIVYEGDYPVFKEMYYKINNGEKTASAVFHNKDLNYCANVTLSTVFWTEDGKPEEVIGFIEDRSESYNKEKLVRQLQKELASQDSNDEIDDALKIMASSIGSQYFAVYYIWLENRTYVCFQEQLKGILSLIGERGQYEPAWEQYINNYIEEKDQNAIREFIEISSLAERIGKKNSISHIYRRKEIGWTRGQFIVGKRDENGTPLTVIYTVSDINEEMETKRKKDEAEQEALHDPLTKLWNRKAFEQFKETKEFKNNQAGILLFDIDRFKGINDQFGHDVGDKVIIDVAEEVRGILRQNDLVFRMGGDEFAVLLYNCNASVWNTICRKIEMLHIDIKGIVPSEMSVTISAGLCVNEDGYCDEMYKLADQAMYNTKVNGRGGCTFIGIDGQIKKEWHDNRVFLRKGDILEKNSTVTWRMDKPKRDGLPYRVYGDELFKKFFGLENSSSPEELYEEWVVRIAPDNIDIIHEAAKNVISDGKVEVVFMWNHPDKGLVQLRCSAYFETETDDYYSFIGYIHVITGTHVFTMEDIGDKVKNALEEMYFCNFYIRLRDYSFKIYKAQPYMMEMLNQSKDALSAVKSYVEYMVAEESKAEMMTFLDLSTLKKRLAKVNMIGASYNDPNIGWSRMRFLVVDRNEKGEPETVALVVESENREESQYEKEL